MVKLIVLLAIFFITGSANAAFDNELSMQTPIEGAEPLFNSVFQVFRELFTYGVLISFSITTIGNYLDETKKIFKGWIIYVFFGAGAVWLWSINDISEVAGKIFL